MEIKEVLTEERFTYIRIRLSSQEKNMKLIFIIIFCYTLVSTATPLEKLPKRNITGEISEILFTPELILDSELGIKNSAYYTVILLDVTLSLEDPSDTFFVQVETGDFDEYDLLLSPTDDVKTFSIGESVAIRGYTITGDEFSQRYRYDSLAVESVELDNHQSYHVKSSFYMIEENRIHLTNRGEYSVKVFSVNGQILKELSDVTTSISLDTLGLSKGVYFIRVIQGAAVFSGQFIIK